MTASGSLASPVGGGEFSFTSGGRADYPHQWEDNLALLVVRRGGGGGADYPHQWEDSLALLVGRGGGGSLASLVGGGGGG